MHYGVSLDPVVLPVECGCCGVEVGCCPGVVLPNVLHAEVTGVNFPGGCDCLVGVTFDLTYDADGQPGTGGNPGWFGVLDDPCLDGPTTVWLFCDTNTWKLLFLSAVFVEVSSQTETDPAKFLIENSCDPLDLDCYSDTALLAPCGSAGFSVIITITE